MWGNRNWQSPAPEPPSLFLPRLRGALFAARRRATRGPGASSTPRCLLTSRARCQAPHDHDQLRAHPLAVRDVLLHRLLVVVLVEDQRAGSPSPRAPYFGEPFLQSRAACCWARLVWFAGRGGSPARRSGVPRQRRPGDAHALPGYDYVEAWVGSPVAVEAGGGRGVERRASRFPATGCEDTGEVGPGDRICLTLMTGLEHIK